MNNQIAQQLITRVVRDAMKDYKGQSAGFDFHLFDRNCPPSTVDDAIDILRGEQQWHENHAIEVERCLDEWIRKLEDMKYEANNN